ncbi:MAG: hypothetical protein ACT4RN_14760 [Pseudonocardia sp.]
MRRMLRACGRVITQNLATEHGWVMAWMWVGYPPPMVWAAGRAPDEYRELLQQGGWQRRGPFASDE